MSTLIMMASPLIYKLIYEQGLTCEYRNSRPTPGLFEKKIYYNKFNKPLNELLDNDGNPINLSEYTIMNGDNPEKDENKVVQDLGKNWFVQWCEVAAYYVNERRKHITDEIWLKMDGDLPPPTPPVNNPGAGSPPAKYALNNVFRIMPTPLLTDYNWYVLWEESNLPDSN